MSPNPPQAVALAVVWKLTEQCEPRERDLNRGLQMEIHLGDITFQEIKTFFQTYLSIIDIEEVRQARGASLIEKNQQIINP